MNTVQYLAYRTAISPFISYTDLSNPKPCFSIFGVIHFHIYNEAVVLYKYKHNNEFFFFNLLNSSESAALTDTSGMKEASHGDKLWSTTLALVIAFSNNCSYCAAFKLICTNKKNSEYYEWDSTAFVGIPVRMMQAHVRNIIYTSLTKINVLKVGIHVESGRTKVIRSRYVWNYAFSIPAHVTSTHPHVPIPHLKVEKEKLQQFSDVLQLFVSLRVGYSRMLLNPRWKCHRVQLQRPITDLKHSNFAVFKLSLVGKPTFLIKMVLLKM